MPTRTGSQKQPAQKKPYRDFPLSLHPTGQWAKKIRGRTIDFGADADAAVRKYLEQRDDLQAGRTPRVPGHGLTVRDLCHRSFWQFESSDNAEPLLNSVRDELKESGWQIDQAETTQLAQAHLRATL